MAGGPALARRGAAVAALAAVAAEAYHLAPGASRLDTVRRLFHPELAGYGRLDHVALTFDDGPSPDSTPYFLDALDELGVRATFFLLGELVDRTPELAADLVGRGHEPAVHGFHHRSPFLPGPARDLRELSRTVEAIEAACRVRPRWYRPPYGVLTRGLRDAARELNLRPVLWTVWGKDWTAHATAASVRAHLSPGLHGGATVLLHDCDITSAPGSWRAALETLPWLVETCRELGLDVGPLSEHGLRD